VSALLASNRVASFERDLRVTVTADVDDCRTAVARYILRLNGKGLGGVVTAERGGRRRLILLSGHLSVCNFMYMVRGGGVVG
jgi:hypothetical protein